MLLTGYFSKRQKLFFSLELACLSILWRVLDFNIKEECVDEYFKVTEKDQLNLTTVYSLDSATLHPDYTR